MILVAGPYRSGTGNDSDGRGRAEERAARLPRAARGPGLRVGRRAGIL